MFYKGFIEVDSEKIEELFDRIDKAREEIYDCYSELEQIGIVKIKREPANEDGGQEKVTDNENSTVDRSIPLTIRKKMSVAGGPTSQDDAVIEYLDRFRKIKELHPEFEFKAELNL